MALVFKAKPRKYGKSLWITIPKKIIEKEHITLKTHFSVRITENGLFLLTRLDN